MKISKSFLRETSAIALPVAFQSLLQTSFSLIDQMMVGQLGQTVIAGTGIAVKFSMIFNSLAVTGLSSSAAIMISQYFGQKNMEKASRSFWQNLMLCLLLGLAFMVLCQSLALPVCSLYTPDQAVRSVGAQYLQIYSLSFPLIAVSTICAVWLRCSFRAGLVTISALAGAICNTLFNWLFIFELPAFRGYEAAGAALASVIAQAVMALINVIMVICSHSKAKPRPHMVRGSVLFGGFGAFLLIVFPLMAGETLWSLAENIYSMVYGQLSTEGLAAMTITGPVQGAYFGLLAGLGQAAAILVGRRLGEGNEKQAVIESKWMMKLAFGFSCALALLVILISPFYVSIYQISDQARTLSITLLAVFALFSLVKVQNMVIGGGILRSGGKTTLTLIVDLIGTWLVGVPAAILTGSFLHLNIVAVYSCISCEEIVRYLISLFIFKKGIWMRQLG